MHAENPPSASIHRISADTDITSTEVLIVGFGFSIIPLLRELERDGTDYIVISGGESIWDRLERHDRLDFDMVSSMHSSLYSFELVKRDSKDRYLPVKEFQAFIKKYQAEYSSHVVKDWVTGIENHASRSIVRTRSGRMFAGRHLICATAFNRQMNHQLNDFDYASAKNKTIAITAVGDSVNLMISKLIPYNNRIVLVTNGALMLDKLSFYNGTSYTLDQLEYHNVRHLSNTLYRKTFFTGTEFVVLCKTLFGFPPIEHLYFKHPMIRRPVDLRYLLCRSPVPNGSIVIKYWPIDAYQRLFDNASLKQSIKDGFLLNDLAYFVQQALIELWPKSETEIDHENQTIRWKENVIRYDYLIDGDNETANLPEIVVHDEDGTTGQYEYVCRNCFLGIVPKELRNVYFIGYIRPMTGGLNSIIEMQCLFTHKMIKDARFHDDVYRDIGRRIRAYDRDYRLSKTATPTDHLVSYGFYNDEVARVMKINSRLKDCRSLKDLVMHFIFPNIPFKFRQSGPYKVEGVKEMVHQIYKDHNGFSIVLNWLLTYILLQATAYLGLIMAWYQQPFHFPTPAFLLTLLLVLLNPVSSFVAASAFGRNASINAVLLAGLALTVVYPSPLTSLGSWTAACGLAYFLRQMGWTRLPFNDLKNKKAPKYREFFDRYCDTFRQLFATFDADSMSQHHREKANAKSPATARRLLEQQVAPDSIVSTASAHGDERRLV